MSRQKHEILGGKVQMFKRKNSSLWQMRYSHGGEQFKSSLGTPILKKAKKIAEDRYLTEISELIGGRPRKPKPFSEVANSFIETRREHVELNNKSMKSFEEQYEARVNNYIKPYFADKLIKNIDESVIDGYTPWRQKYWTKGPGKDVKETTYVRNGKKVTSPITRRAPNLATLKREIDVIRMIFEHAVSKKWLDAADIPEFNYPSGKVERSASFQPFEVQKILDHLEAQIFDPDFKNIKQRRRLELSLYKCVITIAAFTALRPIEFENLRWRNVYAYTNNRELIPFADSLAFKGKDRKVRLVGVWGKTDPRYVVPVRSVTFLFSSLWEVWEYITGKPPEPDDPVLFDMKGEARKWPTSKFTSILAELGIREDEQGRKRSPYSLRHYAISEWLKQGIPWQDVAKNAGNSVKQLKEHYDHVTVEQHADKFELMTNFNKMDDIARVGGYSCGESDVEAQVKFRSPCVMAHAVPKMLLSIRRNAEWQKFAKISHSAFYCECLKWRGNDGLKYNPSGKFWPVFDVWAMETNNL